MNTKDVITTEWLQETSQTCDLDGNLKIKIVVADKDIEPTQDNPEDWRCNYIISPADAKCEGVRSNNPVCNANMFQQPVNGCGGNLYKGGGGTRGICGMKTEAKIWEHLGNVYDAFEKSGRGGCKAPDGGKVVGAYDCAQCEATVSWKFTCVTKQGNNDTTGETIGDSGPFDPCPEAPPQLELKCLTEAPGELYRHTTNATGARICANSGKLAYIYCNDNKQGYYCCPKPNLKACTPGVGFFSLSQTITSGYATDNCPSGKSYQYFTPATPPQTVKDIANYGVNAKGETQYTTVAGYYNDKTSPTNPYRGFDTQGALETIRDWLYKLGKKSITNAISNIPKDFAYVAALNECNNNPDCTESVFEITKISIKNTAMDPDPAGGCGLGVVDGPGGPMDPILPPQKPGPAPKV